MHVHVDSTRRCDQAFAVAHRGAGADDQPRVNPVHHRRVAGLAETGDPAVPQAEVAFNDAQHRIDQHDVAQQHIQRAGGAGDTGSKADAITQCLAAAV